MDRSPEKSALLSTKVHSLEAKTGSTRQQFAHEAATTNAIFRPPKVFPSQSTQENSSKAASYSSTDAGLGRNSEQFISPLQAQYCSPTVPTAALGMSLPYGMIAGPGMDTRALNAGNLFYTYGSPVMSFPNYAAAGYGQSQRVKSSEETTASDKAIAVSTQLRPTEQPNRSSKEPMRTESVIKTVTDKQEIARKLSDPDKRSVTGTQGPNIPMRYPDKGTVTELGNSVDGKKGLPLRDSSLRDMPMREQSLRDAQRAEDMSRRDKQSIVSDFDRSREKPLKTKTFEHLGVDSVGMYRPSNGLTSRTAENGAMSFSSHDKNFISSEARSSPYLANEPPTLVPYHNTLPPRSSISMTHSNVPSTMPKLTPIAPRMSNGSPLTVSYSSEAEHRNSPSLGTKRQNYVNTTNPVSSEPSVTSHSVTPWTANYHGKPPQGERADENWRTKQNPREERDLNRTGGYDPAQKLHLARKFHPQAWERPLYYSALPPQVRAAGGDKDFSEDVDSRDVSRDSTREGIKSSDQSQAKMASGGYKYSTVPVNLRKESDLVNTKIPASSSQDAEYQKNQPFVGRNEKSVIGEYVNYNKNDDGKGSLGNVIVHGKEGSFRISVERREGGQKSPKPKVTKPSRMEQNRAVSSYSSNYDGREQSEGNYIGMQRGELKSTRDDKAKEGVDRARHLEPPRSREQSLYQEHTGRKPDSRELSSLNDDKKINDRNNNSTSLGAFPFYKHGAGGFPLVASGEQMRFVERGPVCDDKVSVPPNMTLDRYEKREQEIEKNAFKRTDFNAFSRNVEGSHSLNPNDECSKRNEERRGLPRRDEAKPKVTTGRFENDKRVGDAEEISSDENDDGTTRVSRETVSPEKRAQIRVSQSSDRTASSPAAGAIRQRRLSSPLSDQRGVAADKRNIAVSNAYGASIGPSLQNRRIVSDGSDGHSRESNTESGMEVLGNSGPPQFFRMDGGAAFPSPYYGQLLPTPQGLSEAPVVFFDPASFYGAMYRPHLMEAAPQGMFSPGTFADPVTGQIMMIPPETYIPMVAAENPFMNPMMDPRIHAMWGMPGAIDEAQWQQFYQMMQPFQQQQQKQQQQLLEQSKQEFLLGKHSAQFPMASYPFYYGDKHSEQKRKEEIQDVKSTEHQQKSREVQQESLESQAKETATRPKPEPAAQQERVQRMPASRESEFVQQQEISNQRDDKSATDSRWMKEAHQKLVEKQKKVQAKIDAQGQMAKQIKEYLSLEAGSQFPFTGPQTSFLRDNPSVNLSVPVTSGSARTPEVDRKSVSPKTVSAAVTLSSLEKSRAQEHNSAGRLSPQTSSDARVVTSQNSVVDRVKSPRLRPWTESTSSNEIVETPRRLEAQPNLLGERLVSRESRELPTGSVPLPFPQKLMAFGNIASERLLREKAEQDSERQRFGKPFRAYDESLSLNFNEMSRGNFEKPIPGNFGDNLPKSEDSHRVQSYGEMMTSFVKSEIERAEKEMQPVHTGLRESVDSQEDSRANFQALVAREKLSPPEHHESDSDYEDDFRTKCELRRLASSFVPLKPDLENKENSTIFSLRPVKSEAERKEIRDNIDRLRSMAKRRNSKDRFKVFSRRSDLRSPTTILNGVTSAVGGDVAGVESVEKEMRMKLAELQKRYREKVRELARLQPKYGVEDGNGKSTPIKRGPGRPRKRKYFGASSKGDKHSPISTADENRDGAESLLVSSAQSPEPPSNAVASESDSLLSKESEPPKKKKRRMKHNNPVEQEVHRTATPTLGISPVEPSDVQVPTVKKKKSRKPSAVEEESAAVALSKSKPTDVKKKKAAGAGKRRKGSPTENALEQQVTAQIPTALPEMCAKELETNANFMEPEIPTKNTKTKKLKPKKRARPKLTVDTPESYVGKADDESPLGSAAASGETPPSTKSKKTKGKKKNKNSTAATPSKAKFEFRDATSQDDSFSENSSVSPNEIAKEVVAMAAKQMEAQRNSRQIPSDNDDDVFTTNHDGRDGLSLLAQASFETADKSTKRKRSSENSALSEDLSQKKRGRPKKDMESPLSEPDAPVAPKKKKKKKVLEEDSTKQPKKKKKKKKKKVTTPKEGGPEEKPARVQQEEQPEPPSFEQQEKIEIKQPEMPAANEDSEQDEDVFRPAAEVSKDTRPSHSTSGISREGDDMKGSISSLLSDEWQPRRSERIFINSSVTTNSSPSPLSPTGKGNEFFYGKKTKKGPGIRGKSSRSDSQVEEELAESDAIVPQKGKGKVKKKRGPVKGKKRIPSDEDYEPLKISRRARSKSRQPIDFDDEDEEEPDDLQEDQELHEEGETDVEISITDKMDTSADGSEEKGQQSESVENENIIKPEAEEEKMETEVKDDKEDVEMEVDEIVEDKNDTREAIKADVVEESKEKESTEEITRSEEMTEQKEASCERASSPVDVRFTFLIEELREGTKLLVPVDSFFFPGRISTFNEPDLFGVVLDGERGRRPHWKSTEQLLTRAVKDIQPPSAKFIPIGTRVCAQWSPQYRCFYPGTVTEAPPDEKEVEGKTWIEFDDGDSGFFQLNEIKRIHPDFPVEDAENTPTMPEKSPRSSSLGPLQSKAIKDSSSRLRAEENTSEFSSGNESSGEIQAKRRRLRGKRKSKDDSWIVSKQTDNNTKESNSNKGETVRSKTKENEKSGAENTGSLTKVKDKNQSSSDSQENKVSDAHAPPRQKSSKIRGKIETNVESKETTRTAENTKHDLPSNASAELKESEKEIHSSDSSLKTGDYENNAKQSSDKVRAAAENNTEFSDQGEDSDANSDVETSKNEKGARGGTKGSSRTSEKDLRRRSLTLNLNSSFRSSRADGESPTRDALSTSQDEDSESYSDAFDESPLVENKSFQPRLGRRRRSELDRLQVDMKFSGPLWQWSGRNFQNKRKGKGKKVFYRAIVRGDETISVGDCAVFMSNPTKNLNLPYVGKIESMWEGCGGNMVVRVKWFYHPEETKPGRKPTDGKQSLYRSTHVDENDVQTISHKCEVLTPEEFKRRFQSLESPGTRTSLSDRVFCCIGSYDPNSETLQPEL